MKKNRHYLLLLTGILLINAEIVLRPGYSVSDFFSGMLKGLGIVAFVAFIYYSLTVKNVSSEEVPDK